jgi:tetratricopeptide (TPR) repeat protein
MGYLKNNLCKGRLILGTKELQQSIEIYNQCLEGSFHDLAMVCADVLVDEEAKKQTQMLSKKANQERFEMQINQELHTFKARIENGTFQIMQKLIGDTEMFSSEVVEDLAKLVQIANSVGTDPDTYLEQLNNDKTLVDIAKVNQSTFEKLYQAAIQLYVEEQFEHSSDAFGFLTIINSQNYNSWLGLGNSLVFLKRYEEALIAYAWCCLLNPESSEPHINSCYCYEAINEIDNAINSLDLAMLVTGNDQEQSAHLIQEKQRLVMRNS